MDGRHSLSFKMAGLVLAQNGIFAGLLFYMSRHAAPLVLVGLAAVLIGLTVVTLMFARDMAATLKSIAGMTSKLAAGEVAIAESELHRDDEIGVIARHLEHLSRHHLLRLIESDGQKDEEVRQEQQARARDVEAARLEIQALMGMLDALDSGMRRLAVGDLTVRLAKPFPERFEGLRGDFNRALATIEETFSRINGTAHQLHGDCSETRKTAEDAAEAAALQAAALADAAKDLSTLTETLRGRKMQAAHTGTIAYNAGIDMRRPQEMMEAASEEIGALRAGTEAIEAAAATIREIAFEANMLALNAGIEANHVDGREDRFVIIAEEMRTLAERLASTATEISARSRHSTEAAQGAAKSVGKVAGELDAMAIYARALQDQAQTIVVNAGKEIETASTIRASLTKTAKASREQIAVLDSLTARIGSLWRDVGSIDRNAGRFTPVTVVAEGSFLNPESAKPAAKRGAHLRLVKS